MRTTRTDVPVRERLRMAATDLGGLLGLVLFLSAILYTLLMITRALLGDNAFFGG